MRSVFGDPLFRRSVFWLALAALAVWLTHYFRVAFAYDRMYLLFAPKVPFLGLIITAGTFQYRTWRQLADRDYKRITDPQWLEFERRVRALQARVQAAATVAPLPAAETLSLPAWEKALKERKASIAEIARVMLVGILPHSTALLGNFLFIGVCLLLSSAADTALFLAGRDVPWLREVSSALFAVTLLPFLESAVRYYLSLYLELRGDRRWFQEQHDKTMSEKQ